MTGATFSTLAILVQLALGLAVFQANRRRLANQCFLLLSLTIAAWLGCLFLAFSADSAQVAEFAIRQASVAGAIYVAVLNLLRLAVRQREQSWGSVLRDSRWWLATTIGVAVLCQTKLFFKGAQISQVIGVAPTPIYGWGMELAYNIYL